MFHPPAHLPLLVRRLTFIGLALAAAATLGADAPAPTAAPADRDAKQSRLESKADRLLPALNLDDRAATDRVRAILVDWLSTLAAWHAHHDPELRTLWSRWSEARSVVPKDEYPGEVIAHQINGIYDSLRPAYAAFLQRLATELSPAQIDTLKETWSRSPGMERTYRAYLDIVPDLTDAQKQVIRERLLLAREAAMLTDSDREIVNLFKVHKVKVEAYVGTLQWAKLHSAFAHRGK